MPTVRENATRIKRSASSRPRSGRTAIGSWSGSMWPRPSTCPPPARPHPDRGPHAHHPEHPRASRSSGPAPAGPAGHRVPGDRLWARTTGTYHRALATFLEGQGADVVLSSSSVAAWNRRTQDGTWDKNDRKDAANCADLLEQGKVLFYSQPTGALAELRHLVRLLRRARTELASCKARWRTPSARVSPPGGSRSRTASVSNSRRAPGLGAADPRRARPAEGPAPARGGDGLRRPRRPGDGGAGPDRDARDHPDTRG